MPSMEGWARKMNRKPEKNKKSCRQAKRGKGGGKKTETRPNGRSHVRFGVR